MRAKIILRSVQKAISENRPSFFREYVYPIIGWMLSVSIFLTGIWYLEGNRGKDELESRFNDLKRDLFSENLSLVELAVEDIVLEYGNPYRDDKHRIKFIAHTYELLGKRFVSLAPDREWAELESSPWTPQRKMLCSKILMYTAYIPVEIIRENPWQIQGKYLTGLNFQRSVTISTESKGVDYDILVGEMLLSKDFRPRLNNAFINNCNFDQSEFLFVDFTGAEIKNSSFNLTDFQVCLLDSLTLTNCDFKGADLRNSYFNPTIMLSVDLRNIFMDSLT